MKQRGTALVYALAGLAILGSLIVLYGMYKAELTKADKAGYDRAIKEVALRDKKDLEESQVQIAGLTLERDTQAALRTAEQAKLKRDHDKEIANAKAENNRMRAGLASGSIVLRDPGRAGEGGAWRLNPDGNSGRGAAAPLAALAGGSGQAPGAELSRGLSENLWAEAERADEVRADLALCWGIAKDDRARAAAP